MKVTEGILILSIQTLLLSIWYFYGSVRLLHGMLTNTEVFIASFDQLHINGEKVYYQILAFVYPLLTVATIISCVGVLKGKRVFAICVIILSSLFIANEAITQIMDDTWFHQTFFTPHFTPILYVFNIVFFSYKLWVVERVRP